MGCPDRQQRGRRAQARGSRAERWAAAFLWLTGWRLIARNLKTPFGEIDLLARRGSVLAVVEVKSRDSAAAAAEAIRPDQRARLLRAGAWIQERKPGLKGLHLRFDALLIRPWRWPHRLRDAWGED